LSIIAGLSRTPSLAESEVLSTIRHPNTPGTICSSLLGTSRRNRAPLRCRYLYLLASLPPHGLVTICSSLLGTRLRNMAPRRFLYLYRVLHGLILPARVFAGSWGFVSTCFSAATRTGDDLFESLRHFSSQSSTLSLSICIDLLLCRHTDW
jgi:hypothetical protein